VGIEATGPIHRFGWLLDELGYEYRYAKYGPTVWDFEIGPHLLVSRKLQKLRACWKPRGFTAVSVPWNSCRFAKLGTTIAGTVAPFGTN